MARVTEAEHRRRLDFVRAALIKGATDRAAAKAAARQFSVRYDTATRWVREVHAEYARAGGERSAEDVEADRQRLLEMTLDVIGLCHKRLHDDGEDAHPQWAGKILDGIKLAAELTGAAGAKRVEITGPKGGPLEIMQEMTNEDLEAELERSGFKLIQGGKA